MRLSSSQSRLITKRAEEDPAEHDLNMTRIDEPLRLDDDIVNRLAPQAWAKRRDDAIRAVRVASILDLQERALMTALMLAQQRQRRRSDPDFSVDNAAFAGFTWGNVLARRSACLLYYRSIIPKRFRRC